MLRAKQVNPIIVRFASVLFCVSCPNFWGRYGSAQPNSNSSSGSPCDAYGFCGAFGICNPQQSPVCSCLTGFYPSNRTGWDSSDWMSGCLRRAPLNCRGSNGTTSGGRRDCFLNLRRLKMSHNNLLQLPLPEDQCGTRCLSICSCLAYAFETGNRCTFWTNGSLIDVQTITNASLGSDIHIRLASSELGGRKGSYKNILILLSMVVVGLVLMLSVCSYFTWKWKATKRRGNVYQAGSEGEEFSETGASGLVDLSHQCAIHQLHLEELPLYKFDILANATDYFSEPNKLRVGGFGLVYKKPREYCQTGEKLRLKGLRKHPDKGYKNS